MTMPTWDGFMAPLLRVLSDGSKRSLSDLVGSVSTAAELTDQELADQLPSGQSTARNRIGWAASYLTRVGALHRPRRGHYTITDLGRQLLVGHPDGLTEADIRPLAKPGDEWWIQKGPTAAAETTNRAVVVETETSIDPTEQIEQGIERIHQEVAAELRDRLLAEDPDFFERAVVRLLVAMGYGGAEGRATTTQRSNDEGIDGIIDQDALGLSRVYIQAKRYAPDRSVGRPDLQAFVGALSGKADGGVFITTAGFSSGARTYAENVPVRLILIDGTRLTDLMIRYGVGVQVKSTYHAVEVDEDFFE